MHRLVSSSHIFINDCSHWWTTKLSGGIPKIQNLGSRGRSFPVICLSMTNIFLQKSSMCGHSHKQWSKDPLWPSLHLIQVSGSKWWSLTGVIYCLVSHLYCNNMECVLIDCLWIEAQAVVHSSLVIFLARSEIHDWRILFEDF